MTTSPDERPVTVHLHQPARKKWQWWRDAVLVLLSIAVLALITLVGGLVDGNRSLQKQIATSSAARSKQFTDLTTQLNDLQQRLGMAQAIAAVKDARIKQLTDQILALGVRPVPAPTVRASSSNGPTPVPLPLPFPQVTPTPTPAPTPGPSPTGPPTPSSTPTPTPTCLVLVLGVCVLPATP